MIIDKKLNRKIPPAIHEVRDIKMPLPVLHKLDNGIPVYETQLGTQEIMKIDIVYLCGRPEEAKRLTSRAVSRLLREGTTTRNAFQIADDIEFFAGTLQTPVHLDTVNIGMYCMTKHFASLLPILSEMIHEPTYPEKELRTWANNNIERLKIELTKNETLAYRKITETIFGAQTAYGYSSTLDNYKALSRQDVLDYHDKNFATDNCIIFLSGKTTPAHFALVNKFFGQSSKKKSGAIIQPYSDLTTIPQKIKIKNPDTLQAAIRIGKRIGNRKSNPEYYGFMILNTILGGYFGSRLMTNIREEKGYTYNIYSSTDIYKNDGYFYISSEVGNKFVNKAIKEIYIELDRLQNELVSDEELKMVRNYMLGNSLNMVDGPFAVGEVVRGCVLDDVPFSVFDDFIQTVQSITPEDIRLLAQKYFNRADMTEVVAGV